VTSSFGIKRKKTVRYLAASLLQLLKKEACMNEISKEARMIIASNLTVAAAIRDAAMTIKGGDQAHDSKDLVTSTFAKILTSLEKQSLGRDRER
jgi:hypothetical protein